MLHSIYQQIWKTQQDWKRSVFIPIPKKGNVKECSNYCTTALISHANKVMLKIFQAETQAGIKIARAKFSNLRYADDTTLMEENKEELKSLLMNVHLKGNQF